MTHRLEIRVFYEDTDMAGIVYYANYLRYIERGRSSMLRELGFSQNALKDQDGIVFAVTAVDAKYKRPAVLDDLLVVETAILAQTKARVVFEQKVLREDEVLFVARVDVATLKKNGRPAGIPDTAREIFERFQA
ncbi:MAG: tol-pal system-associated acyl-CoA thioesterase [Pseudomonadota bacterium]